MIEFRKRTHQWNRSNISGSLAAIVSALLNPITIRTVGGTPERKELVTREVPQSSPLSPVLFNMFIDIFTDTVTYEMTKTNSAEGDCKITLFADDVKFMENGVELLHKLLNWSAACAEKRK